MAGGVVKTIAEQIYADQTYIDLSQEAVDSLAVLVPPMKKGSGESTQEVLESLDISADSAQQAAAKIIIKEALVPNTVGMGAKDALYLLESKGLEVSLNGFGTVASQSLAPGTRIRKGGRITLRLRPN